MPHETNQSDPSQLPPPEPPQGSARSDGRRFAMWLPARVRTYEARGLKGIEALALALVVRDHWALSAARAAARAAATPNDCT